MAGQDEAQGMHVPILGPLRLHDHTFSTLSGAAAGIVGDLCCWASLPVPVLEVVEAMSLGPWSRVLLSQKW